MKYLLAACLLLAATLSQSQTIEKYYDYNWKEVAPNYARFYSLTVHTDSGWTRRDYYIHENSLQAFGLCEDSACKVPSGSFYSYHPNRKLKSMGVYRHGKKQGVWISLYSDGSMQDSLTYEEGHLSSTCLKWHRNGRIADSAVSNADGSGVSVSWFDNGNPSSAGRFAAGNKQHDKWKYFRRQGGISSQEIYDQGKLVERQYFNEQGVASADTACTDAAARFPGGPKAWGKYLNKHLSFPNDFKITNGDRAVVIVSAVVDEEGKIRNAEVSTPFYPAFDEIALKALLNSPAWIPAMEHNRHVKHDIRQPVIFGQPED